MFEVISSTSSRAWLKQRDFQLCTSINQLIDYVSHAGTEIALDWETTSLDVEKAKPVGIGVSTDPKHGIYVPVGHQISPQSNLSVPAVLEILHQIDERLDSWWWGYTYDGEFQAQAFKIELNRWQDAMTLAYLENPNVNVYGLKPTAMRLLGVDMITFEEVTKGRNFSELDPTDQQTIDYGCSDVACTLEIRLLPNIARVLKADPQYGQKFIYDMERKVNYCVRDAERNKCWIDRGKLSELQVSVKAKTRSIEQEIYDLAGGEFDIGSPKVLGNKLVELGIPITERTKKANQVSTGKEILLKYVRYHPIVEKINQYKELTTQCRNYIDKLIAGVDSLGPLLKFRFHHIGVPTGRMKAGGEGKAQIAYDKGVTDLNVQSVPDPKKKPYLPNIRSAFVANNPNTNEREFVILSIDYGQLQARIAANLSREPLWIKAFNSNVDLHMMNARAAYRDNSITKEDPRRDKGKTLTYAILFGGSEYTVRDHGGIPIEQAKSLVDGFFGAAPQLKKWIDSWIQMAQHQRFIKTPFGRMRPLTEYYPEGKTFWKLTKIERKLWNKGDREAVNGVIQGAEADIYKIACIKIRKMLNERSWNADCKVVLFEHDEVVFRVRRSLLETIVPEIRKCMEFEVKGWPVALVTEAEVGYTDNSNWGQMCPYETFIQGEVAIKAWQAKKAGKKLDDVTDDVSESDELKESLEESLEEWM